MKEFEKKMFSIPRQISKEIYLYRNFKLKEVLCVAGTLGIGYAIGFRSLPNNANFHIKEFICLLPAASIGLLILRRPIKERDNIRFFHTLLWHARYNLRQKVFHAIKVTKKKTEKSILDAFAFGIICDNMIETNNRVIKVLSVSAVNMSLMSHNEQKEIYERYESFLKKIDASIQISRMSSPIDLNDYIRDMEDRLQKETNPYKKLFLKSYIWHTNYMQEDREMIRRKRYVVIDESFGKMKSKEKAIMKLNNRVDNYKMKLEEMLITPKLDVTELNNKELEDYIQLFFNYEKAQVISSY